MLAASPGAATVPDPQGLFPLLLAVRHVPLHGALLRQLARQPLRGGFAVGLSTNLCDFFH